MNFISEVKEFSNRSDYSDLHTMINFPIKNKYDILKFLKSFSPVATMTHGIKDYLDDNQNINESLQLFNSDSWFWTNEMVYHFEKYNLKLNDDFINHILNQIRN